MKRRSFVKTGCAACMLSVIPELPLNAESQSENQKKVAAQINADQIKSVLKFIDSTQPSWVKESIFGKLGSECFYSRKLENWVDSFGDIDSLIRWVNIDKKSRYWEKLEFTGNRTVLKLTGKITSKCACLFAEIPEPPKSLCSYCCKSFHEVLFGRLIGNKVNAEITESNLYGNDRCNTLIRIV